MSSPNSIDASDARYKLLGHLYKPVAEASTPDSPEYDALKVPTGDIPAQYLLLSRLLDLFVASSAGNFDQAQLGTIREALGRAMPDPAKYSEEFVGFVLDRCHGVLEMLRLLVALQNAGAKKIDVIQEAVNLGSTAIMDGNDLPTPLNALTARERNLVMHQRVDRVSMRVDTLRIHNNNRNLFPLLVRKYVSLQTLFDSVITAFQNKLERLGQTDTNDPLVQYRRTQWFSVLLARLNGFNVSSNNAQKALQGLVDALNNAPDVAVFTTAIDNFAGTGAAVAAN